MMRSPKRLVRSLLPGPYARLHAHRLRQRELRIFRDFQNLRFANPPELVEAHFSAWVNDYQNTQPGFLAAISALGGRPANIIETGTSAWGTDSTRLFDRYVHQFGGRFWTADIRPEPARRLTDQLSASTETHLGDSVAFLQDFPMRHPKVLIDLFFLDSYDLEWSSPLPAAEHALNEWHALLEIAAPRSLVLVDDTPASMEWIPKEVWRREARTALERDDVFPGKGALILKEIKGDPRFTVLWHGYNLLVRLDREDSHKPE